MFGRVHSGCHDSQALDGGGNKRGREFDGWDKRGGDLRVLGCLQGADEPVFSGELIWWCKKLKGTDLEHLASPRKKRRANFQSRINRDDCK